MIYKIITKLNATFEFSKKYIWPLLLFAAPVYVAFILLESIIPGLFPNSELSYPLLLVIMFAYNGLFYSLLIFVIDCLYTDKLVSISALRIFIREYFLKISASIILISFISIIGVFFFIIPGIYLYSRLAITPYLLALDNENFQASFYTSYNSSKQYTWIIFICALVISMPQAVLFFDQFANSFFPSWLMQIVGFITSILETVLIYHFYVDIKDQVINRRNNQWN